MIELGLKFTIAYLLGSVLGSLVVGQVRGGVDIRKLGSENAGGTNALRTQGKAFAFWVMLIDVGKGIICVLLLPGFEVPAIGLDPHLSHELLLVAVGFGAILGHVYPIWHDFRGGKGGATAAGVICVLEPVIALPAVAIWLSVILLTRYVGLSTMSVSIGVSVYIALTRLPAQIELFIFSLIVAVLIVYTHRENIKRMLQGTETRLEMVRFGK
ncbi:MAG: glycerol-3-phosphate 1-O-acyltransferase PlsY [Gammaproteobacteria bacterium]|nr:glycerol-3-phosphate 1-O-acyltransferase PlsY [Gammaproteobacteria bacterium]|tara:strand:+ start:446 stop:1084 length:639 start_codon:yes stop_codon:yes gene_type:complete